MFSRRTEADPQPDVCITVHSHKPGSWPGGPLPTQTTAAKSSLDCSEPRVNIERPEAISCSSSTAELHAWPDGHARSPRVDHLSEFIRCRQEGSHRDDSFSHVSPHRHMPHLVHLLSNFIAFSSETGIFMINNGVKGRRQDSSCSVLSFLDSNTYIVGPIDLLKNYWVDISGHTA